MPTTLEALEFEVLRLTHEDRSRLVKSLDDGAAPDAAWDKEAAFRDAEIEEGTAVAVDGKEVVARLRAQIR